MRSSCLLLPKELVEDPSADRKLGPALATLYQALWHPALLSEVESAPALQDVNDIPGGEDAVIAMFQQHHEKLPDLSRNDLADKHTQPIVVDEAAAAACDPLRLLAGRDLLCTDAELLQDFFALGYAYLGLTILFEKMGQDNYVDSWSFANNIREAAAGFLNSDFDTCRHQLQSAFDLLHNARQTVYPATINWLDIALGTPSLTVEQLDARMRYTDTVNIILTAADLKRLRDADENMGDKLRAAVVNGSVEILGGLYDERPLPLLPPQSRHWQFSRGAKIYEEVLGREMESFGSRSLALSIDLPQMLMKYQFRYALHSAFDGSRFPRFREPKLHWTSPDGSVVEALARVAKDGTNPRETLAIFAALADTILSDHTATVVVAHWFELHAQWFRWLLRINTYSPVFGRFEPFSDFFLNSSMPDRSTQTRIEEYQTAALTQSVARKQANPISRWAEHHILRGKFDSLASLLSLHQIATGKSHRDLDELEDAVEAGSAVATEQLQTLETDVKSRLVELALAGAPQASGYLVLNPCSYPRRVCLELPVGIGVPAIEKPIRAAQATPRGTALIMDIPGWGYGWVPKDNPASSKSKETKTPLASGRKLRNEFLEIDIDHKTGGIRGVKKTRTAYSRIGQQLVYSQGSKMICRKLSVTATGPAFGEIVTEGTITKKDGKTVVANYRQQVRLWDLKPHVDIEVHIEPVGAITGDPWENYIGCRWAWPDEKAWVIPANGFSMQPSRVAQLEAPQLLEIRERHLMTDILPHGLPFHHRISERMADTLFVVEGEERRDFKLTVALDLAHPWTAVYDGLWPVVVAPVEQGPPKAGTTGWFAHLNTPNVLCSRMVPIEDNSPGVQMRLVETSGKSTQSQLRFCRTPEMARLVNCKGQLIFDLHVEQEAVPIDFSPHELLQTEVLF